MWKALVRKELRELAGISALALLAYLVLVSGLIGMKVFSSLPIISGGAESVPFVNSTFDTLFSTISLAFAVALGFRQSAWEWARHTYLFLLHRPFARSQIFLIKIAAGLCLLLVISAGCILSYALWAATPGTHPAPFEWSMTADAWRDWLGCSVVYFGSFLSGLRSARWFGTRLLPLAASLFVFIALVSGGPTLAIAAAIAIVVNALVVSAICHVAVLQDYS